MAKNNLTQEDIKRLRQYLAEMEGKIEAGEEVSKSGFEDWLKRLGFHYLIDKLSDAWEFILEITANMF